MEIQEGLFWTQDCERLYYRFWPGDPEKSPVILIHGHGEHSGRYVKFYSYLKDLNCSVGTFDLRGCGLSSGEPAHVERFEDYLLDVTRFLNFLNTRYKLKSPVRLFGHSLGGLIATAWAHQNPEKVSKLILSCPLFGIPHENMLKGLVSVLNRLVPGFVLSNPVNAPFLTHDPEELAKYKRDPLIRKKITVRLVYEMLRTIRFFLENQVTFLFPVTILMAEEDHVVSPRATQEFFSRVSAPQKDLETFPGFFHEIFNEKEQAKVFERLKFYLDRV